MRRWLAAAALAVLPALAWASTEDAWDSFRASVQTACEALVQAPPGASVTIEVNPFGSESYGTALVSIGHPAGTDRMVCILDKRSGTAELTAPFTDAAE